MYGHERLEAEITEWVKTVLKFSTGIQVNLGTITLAGRGGVILDKDHASIVDGALNRQNRTLPA